MADQITVRRPVVVSAFLLVAAAVLLVAFREWLDRPSNPDDRGTAAVIVDPSGQFAPVADAGPDIEEPVESTSADTAARVLPPSNPSSDPLRVVLLPARGTGPDPAATILANSIRQVTLRTLRGMANVEVVDVGPAELTTVVPASVAPERSAELVLSDMSQQHGNATAAEIEVQLASDGSCWALGLDVFRPGGSDSRRTRIRRNSDPGPGNDPESIGIRYAAAIARDRRVPEGAAAAIRNDARNVLIDTTQSVDERISALTTMGSTRLDAETIAAAVELAARSGSSETRKQIWRVLGSANDAALALPMSNALQSDPDASVRLEAALRLRRYRDAADVQSSLAQAARGDVSADVRLAARMSMMDLGEQRAFMLETLLDRSLTPVERLAPMSMSPMPITFSSPEEIGGELPDATLAYAEIISGTDDPDLKLSALSALQRMVLVLGPGRQRPEPHPALVTVLIQTAESVDEGLQRAALYAMRPYADHAGIRVALADVLEDNLQLANQLNIAGALSGTQDANPGPPPPPCQARAPRNVYSTKSSA